MSLTAAMVPKEISKLKPNRYHDINETVSSLSDRALFEMYQAFMVGYVRRINAATFKATIGGVRIGSARYSRLAQINLKTRIVTFSRFAIENVPERGRRYLVIHELAHVKEPSHNQEFWALVKRFEPDYEAVSKELERAFRGNVKEARLETPQSVNTNYPDKSGLLPGTQLLTQNRAIIDELKLIKLSTSPMLDATVNDDVFDCTEEEFDDFDCLHFGTISGGLEIGEIVNRQNQLSKEILIT